MIAKNILPKFYLITPNFEGDIKGYRQALELSLINGIKLVQLRSKNLKYDEYKSLAKEIIPLVHQYGGKIILNQTPRILDEVKADGIHFPSLCFETIHHRPISKKYIFSAACHNRKQLQHAGTLQVDMAVLCPIFKTPSSPKNKAIGWDQFRDLVKNMNFPIYALGGVKPSDFQKARDSGAYGISAMRSLWALENPIDFSLF